MAVLQKVKDFPLPVQEEEETESTEASGSGAADGKEDDKKIKRQTVPNAKHSAEAPFLELDMSTYGDLIKELVYVTTRSEEPLYYLADLHVGASTESTTHSRRTISSSGRRAQSQTCTTCLTEPLTSSRRTTSVE